MAPTSAPEKPAADPAVAPFAPYVGAVVLYQLSEQDCHGQRPQRYPGAFSGGSVNPFTVDSVEPGLCLPAIVTAVFSPECVNAQVLVDGPGGTFWIASRMRGLKPGEWRPCERSS